MGSRFSLSVEFYYFFEKKVIVLAFVVMNVKIILVWILNSYS